jgi:uncharacterized cupredoxin-like copper-binding protein
MKRWFLLGWIVTILLTALTACGGSAPSANGGPASSVVTVHITLTDFKIESSLTTFSQGVSYRFVVTNKSSKQHEFLLGPLMQPGMTMNDVEKQKLFGVGVLAAGVTKSIDVLFTNAAGPGVVEFSCHVGDLYEAGMRREAVVV